MGEVHVLHWGSGRLRVTPWRADPAIAQLTPSADQIPSPEAVGQCLEHLAREGYRCALTSALTHDEQRPFLEAGFTVYERLHLLRHDLRHVPPVKPPAGVRLRRGRRRDRDAVLAVDGAAFSPFWRFDQAGLDDARGATPTSRFRVADADGVVGYAITGRAGSIGYLQRLAVRPDHQGLGVGTALTIDALNWSRRHGARSVLVNTQESNERALALYVHLGFVHEPHGLAVLEHPLDGNGNRA
ncbi:MAG: GNAT family N-acetyltransferase [Acidimicrobiales bacterium]